MQALMILDKVRWHDHWSAEIGRQLKVLDSTSDLFIFDPAHSRDDIAILLKEAPENLYRLFTVEEAPAEDCDFQADSGQCYRRRD